MWTPWRRTEASREFQTETEIPPCKACLVCLDVCPTGALSYERGRWSLDLSLCHFCGQCAAVCPNPLIKEEIA